MKFISQNHHMLSNTIALDRGYISWDNVNAASEVGLLQNGCITKKLSCYKANDATHHVEYRDSAIDDGIWRNSRYGVNSSVSLFCDIFLLNLIVDWFFFGYLLSQTGAAYICSYEEHSQAWCIFALWREMKEMVQRLTLKASLIKLLFLKKNPKKNYIYFYVFAFFVVVYVTEHHYWAK